MSFDSQKLVEIVDLSGRSCAAEGCTARPVAVYSTIRPLTGQARPEASGQSVSYDCIWSCGEHLADLAVLWREEVDDGSVLTGWIQDLMPTCMLSNCSAEATHLALYARNYGSAQRLEALSICARHAEQGVRKMRRRA